MVSFGETSSKSLTDASLKPTPLREVIVYHNRNPRTINSAHTPVKQVLDAAVVAPEIQRVLVSGLIIRWALSDGLSGGLERDGSNTQS